MSDHAYDPQCPCHRCGKISTGVTPEEADAWLDAMNQAYAMSVIHEQLISLPPNVVDLWSWARRRHA